MDTLRLPLSQFFGRASESNRDFTCELVSRGLSISSRSADNRLKGEEDAKPTSEFAKVSRMRKERMYLVD